MIESKLLQLVDYEINFDKLHCNSKKTRIL